MACKFIANRADYDIQVLKNQIHALDQQVKAIAFQNQHVLPRYKGHMHHGNVVDITKDLVLRYKSDARVFIQNVLNRKEELGYLYNVVEDKHALDHKVYIPYDEFPFVYGCRVIAEVKEMAREFAPEDSEKFCITMLYLLIFYCLLVNSDHMNWVTVEYLSNCNRFHSYAIHVNWKGHTANR